MVLKIPEFALVLLIGPSGAGKSSFARRHFRRSEIVSSDYCRFLVADDENDQAATRNAFEVLHFIVSRRLRAAKLTVVDATNVQPEARRPLLEIANRYYCPSIAVVLNLSGDACRERNRSRPDRDFPPHVLRMQTQNLRQSLARLAHEGFRNVYVLNSAAEIDSASLQRESLACNRKFDRGPFDIIGDVHGCFAELEDLLKRLGYEIDPELRVKPPENRKLIFLGDLVGHGPNAVNVTRLVMGMVRDGSALCVPGDAEMALLHQLCDEAVEPAFRAQIVSFFDGLPSHYVLDEGRLVVAHAGMEEEMQGRESAEVREFALLGSSRHPGWAENYRGRAMVVYGHTPVSKLEWVNHTINIDTGCAFGGSLTALRYPEREFVSVCCGAGRCES